MLVWVLCFDLSLFGRLDFDIGSVALTSLSCSPTGVSALARSSLFLLVDDGRAICFVLVKIFGIVSCDLCICVGRWREALLVVFGFALLARGKLVGFLSFRPRGYVARCRWQVVVVCAH